MFLQSKIGSGFSSGMSNTLTFPEPLLHIFLDPFSLMASALESMAEYSNAHSETEKITCPVRCCHLKIPLMDYWEQEMKQR